ncbi:GLPGLI family protein [Chryseobacterium sp. OSA05B]|uniref:GLPGLI family protein n=1 Tax=Chryseobacterium sp. OSA05B TaxID=2862650 RepID=UPI001CBAAF57|nr:GLPGLI family protein [Chryseobacterium sp. OSA05B]
MSIQFQIISRNGRLKITVKYKSQKAETNYGGRNCITWFITELPFGDGPYIFNGLPELIVSIHDSNKEYSFNLIKVKRGGYFFNAHTKTIKIDWKKYETHVKSYF